MMYDLRCNAGGACPIKVGTRHRAEKEKPPAHDESKESGLKKK